MGSMFRSEEMALCQLFVQPEAAYASVSQLGEMGVAQFRDLNEAMTPFSRKFVSEVRRCDELERRLRYIENEAQKGGVPVREPVELPPAPNPREIIDLEARVEKTETEILELSANGSNLKSNFKELKEMKMVLEKAQTFMAEEYDLFTATTPFVLQQEESDSYRALIQSDERGRLGFIAGVIPRERLPGFERMLWRVSRGNVFLRQAELEEPLEDPNSGLLIHKTAFVAFYQGENLKARLRKVCNGFHTSIYNCPASASEREAIIAELRIRLEDVNVVLSQTMDHWHRVLVSVAKELKTWIVMVRKMKAIYHTLNTFNMDVTNKCLIGECWVPKDELHSLRQALEDGGREVGSSINSFVNVLETKDSPPSFIRLNKFTQGFQTLIDSYSVSTYREVNPGCFTVITFPFLFSVMFGDLGHGIIIALFGAWMCLFERKLTGKKWGEIWDIFFGGRYVILLMGAFSMYAGLMYNDMFSVSLNIFGSAWSSNYNSSTLLANGKLTLDPAEPAAFRGHPFYAGLDPVWQTAENKIVFLNTFKMKFSIIVAVIHMVFGICLSVVNYVHMKKRENIVFDFVPQIVFLLLMFGYMAFMIIFKFFKYYAAEDRRSVLDSHCAPSVLITFINMVLVTPPPTLEGCDDSMFPGQGGLQTAFLLIAILLIPFLLLGKPAYVALKMRAKRAAAHGGAVRKSVSSNGDAVTTGESDQALQVSKHEFEDEEEEEPLSEVMVHQAIHTVEYVLSTVSHTASYLRLWALSLAHAQLSEVLWNMVFRKIIIMASGVAAGENGEAQWSILGGILVYVVFTVWVFFTVSVLVLMEGLSAFLHTLRLHWVEFMSKFYMGTGYAFEPFSFKGIMVERTED